MEKTTLKKKKKKIPAHKLALKNAKKGKRFSRVSHAAKKDDMMKDEEM